MVASKETSARSLAQHRAQVRVRERNSRICVVGAAASATALVVTLACGWHWLLIVVFAILLVNSGLQFLGERGRLARHREAVRSADEGAPSAP